jgi:gas vesicle structural protein
MSDEPNALEEIYEPEQIVLSDLINRVLDKGVVITSHITISVADIDLIYLDLRLLISSVTAMQNRLVKLADIPVRPRPHR